MPTPLPSPRFDHFYRHDELTALLFAYAEARPNLVSVRSIGKSYEGRDIWVVAVTNTLTGAHQDKPAFWADGNIHSIELTGCTAVLFYLHHLATGYGVEPQITQLLDTRVVYLCPRLNPDGAELALADRPRHIRSSTRPYPYTEETVDGLTAEDIDGDGRILTMRVPDPHGGYKKHAGDPRLMVAREPGEFGGEYYRLIPEGFIKNHDGLTVKVNADREGLDLNRNFHDFSKPLPVNEAYRELQPLLLPEQWPPSPANVAAINEYIATRGQAARWRGEHEEQGEFAAAVGFQDGEETNLVEVGIEGEGQRGAREVFIDGERAAAGGRDTDEAGDAALDAGDEHDVVVVESVAETAERIGRVLAEFAGVDLVAQARDLVAVVVLGEGDDVARRGGVGGRE
eukprot:gene42273-51618_t